MGTQNGLLQRVETLASESGGTVSVAVRGVVGMSDLSLRADEVVSSASVIKVPMLVEACRQMRDGLLAPDTPFELADPQRVKGSGVMRYLHTGAVLTLEDLLTLMIVVSDNTATNILVDVLGVDQVNSTMRAMGCTRTTLQRKMYDWEMIEKGLDNLCTAGEMADLLARIARGDALGQPWDAKMLDILLHQQDRYKLGLFLPEGVKLANKTGSREGIMHDCGVVTAGELRYSIAVFTRNAKTPGDAILAIARISRAVYDCMSAGSSTT